MYFLTIVKFHSSEGTSRVIFADLVWTVVMDFLLIPKRLSTGKQSCVFLQDMLLICAHSSKNEIQRFASCLEDQ
jgi:hypothetical protein